MSKCFIFSEWMEENQELWNLALTHRSASSNTDKDFGYNERLEFLGDAVLGAVVAHELYCRYPKVDEGVLTQLKAELVNEKALSRLAEVMGLNELLVANETDLRLGIRKNPRVTSSAFEAVVGAIYLSSGYLATRDFILERMSFPKNINSWKSSDFKTRLQEHMQAEKKQFSYKVQALEEQRFLAQVIYEGRILSQGEGGSKKEAEQMAAKRALKIIEVKV